MTILDIKKIDRNIGIIHFIGIGGIGISGIVELMHCIGYDVQGSDINANYNTARLEGLGVKVFHGHSADNIKGVEYVVISSMIPSNNIELQEAIRKKIPVIKRSEMLSEIMRFKHSICISGSHGKTTTTSLVAYLLEYASLAPTVITGGIINNKHTNAYIGSGDYIVAEVDESDGTFISVPSTIAVVTNIDIEHTDFYGGFDNLVDAFKMFINQIPFYGFAVVCIDDITVKSFVSNIINRKVITYGTDPEANMRIHNIVLSRFGSKFDLNIKFPNTKEELIKDISIPMLGKHNILNAVAAIAVAYKISNIETHLFKFAFQEFLGVNRRFTQVGFFNKAPVIDDYAHHPTEILNTIKSGLTYINNSGRCFVICQPHRYTRLSNLFDNFVDCFKNVYATFITEVYSAGECQVGNIDHHLLIREINERNVSFCQFTENPEALAIDLLSHNVCDSDIIIFVGAGDITIWAKKIVEIGSNPDTI